MTLSVTDLRVHYRTLRGPVKALDGVSFEVADGEIMGIAGESGCGKTTLGKALIRLDTRMEHVGGTVALDGEKLPIADDGAMRRHRYREVSLIPQYAMSAMNPTRKIGRMIRDLLAAHNVRYAEVLPELERRLKLVGLDAEVLKRYPIELSGGMKQRVVLVLSTLLNSSPIRSDGFSSVESTSTTRCFMPPDSSIG